MDIDSYIQLKNVSKYYFKGSQKVTVHENINLTIPKASLVALVGPSGCGKTTLLNLIGGLDRSSEGSIRIGNNELTAISESALSRWRAKYVGFVFQFHNLMPILTAEENVELPLLLTDFNRAERKKRVDTVLKIVGLENRAKHYPRELSGGQEQRVAIARALVTDPELLMCDEPTGNLDRKAADEVMSLLKYLNEELNKTILIVTHDLNLARLCQYTINMEMDNLHELHLRQPVVQ